MLKALPSSNTLHVSNDQAVVVTAVHRSHRSVPPTNWTGFVSRHDNAHSVVAVVVSSVWRCCTCGKLIPARSKLYALGICVARYGSVVWPPCCGAVRCPVALRVVRALCAPLNANPIKPSILSVCQYEKGTATPTVERPPWSGPHVAARVERQRTRTSD